jgi:putative peptidoglycan lipid II flippase
VGEGAANAAMVPVLSEYAATRSREEFWKLANALLNALLVVLSVITLAGIALAPVLVRLMAPGFADDPQKLAVTIALNRVIFPYILLIGLAAYAMAVLNSLKHFSVPAFAPCLLNIAIIASAIFFGEGVRGVAVGVLLGGMLQLAVQVPMLWRKGFRPSFLTVFGHPGCRQIGRLMVPRMASSGIYQLNNFVDSIFGSFSLVVGEGGVAVLYFAYRLIQFPLGVFSTALSQAILPTLSAQGLESSRDNLLRTLSFGVRATLFVLLPATAGFIAASPLIVETLFSGGKFDAYAVEQTSRVLVCYSIGLTAFGLNRILQFCFFALKDTATPARISAVALACSVALNAALMFPLKISGIALATSITGLLSCVWLVDALRRRLPQLPVRECADSAARIALCSGLMWVFCALLGSVPFPKDASAGAHWLRLSGVIFSGAAVYVGSCWVLRVRELRELAAWARSRMAV